MKRCPNGTRRNKKTGECVNKSQKLRCPNGTRRNKKTGNCVPVKKSESLSFGTLQSFRTHQSKSKSLSFRTPQSKSKSLSFRTPINNNKLNKEIMMFNRTNLKKNRNDKEHLTPLKRQHLDDYFLRKGYKSYLEPFKQIELHNNMLKDIEKRRLDQIEDKIEENEELTKNDKHWIRSLFETLFTAKYARDSHEFY